MSKSRKVRSTVSGQDNKNWLTMWQDRQIEFHQVSVNFLLKRFWTPLALKKGARVLVPLCGKSLDMLWLADQGHQVIGIELSPIAVKSFFDEAGLKVKKQRIGNFIRWQSANITVWCGDYFTLTQQQLGEIDIVFDRAALTALPTDIRPQYIQQLRILTTNNTDIFLLTIEDIPKQARKLNAIDSQGEVDDEITALCSPHFYINLVHTELDQDSTNNAYTAHNKVYKLTAKACSLK